ncbi:hypothetical protein TSAR_012639 [Trichomalopsis sarcophagae]|uniref:Tf2-1-like SH3-like domain-containing protein n=1 Tax=Trichomalopsis sarcophagae TaxID=543379 RepID=A0A232F0L2_9HYME|nr:hypothetical protein TSAR_012639 [Trichomalopsis sarcophagae]
MTPRTVPRPMKLQEPSTKGQYLAHRLKHHAKCTKSGVRLPDGIGDAACIIAVMPPIDILALERKDIFEVAEECVKDYNNTIHSSTRFTPNYLLTGLNNSFLPDELNDNNLTNLEDCRKIAFRKSKEIHNQNKEYYDKNVKQIDYKVGDLVYVQSANKLNKDKLDPIRVGPFKIKEKISDVMFLLDSRFRKNESNIFHASKLVPYSDGVHLRSLNGGIMLNVFVEKAAIEDAIYYLLA